MQQEINTLREVRGGDQIVVLRSNKIIFYGKIKTENPKTKTTNTKKG